MGKFANFSPTYSSESTLPQQLTLNNQGTSLLHLKPLAQGKTCSTPPPTTLATHADLLASSLHDILAVSATVTLRMSRLPQFGAQQ